MTTKSEILMEYSALSLKNHCPLGIYITPNYLQHYNKWSGVIFVNKGFYAAAIYHFILTIPSNYPHATEPPTVIFQSQSLFHPLVHPSNGKLSLIPRFAIWRAREDYLFHVLHYIKAMFKKKTLDELVAVNCLNSEAFTLYKEQLPLFTKLASQSAHLSSSDSTLAHPDESRGKLGLKFNRLDPQMEATLRRTVFDVGQARSSHSSSVVSSP